MLRKVDGAVGGASEVVERARQATAVPGLQYGSARGRCLLGQCVHRPNYASTEENRRGWRRHVDAPTVGRAGQRPRLAASQGSSPPLLVDDGHQQDERVNGLVAGQQASADGLAGCPDGKSFSLEATAFSRDGEPPQPAGPLQVRFQGSSLVSRHFRVSRQCLVDLARGHQPPIV